MFKASCDVPECDPLSGTLFALRLLVKDAKPGASALFTLAPLYLVPNIVGPITKSTKNDESCYFSAIRSVKAVLIGLLKQFVVVAIIDVYSNENRPLGIKSLLSTRYQLESEVVGLPLIKTRLSKMI